MTLEMVLEDLGIQEAAAVFAPYWEESAASVGRSRAVLLEADTVRRHAEFCGLTLEDAAHLVHVSQQVEEQPGLRLLVWHCYKLLFHHLDYDQVNDWPSLESVLGESQGVFFLLAALGMVPLVQQKHISLGVDRAVTRATCQQIASFASNYRRMSGGALGIPTKQLYWLRHYHAGRLFRIGRMEYMLKPFTGHIQVYRHRNSGRTVALSGDGAAYNAEGYIDGTQEWTAALLKDDAATSGCPISPYGFALPGRVRLPLEEWDCVLQPDDWTLDMHIPAGGGMETEKCHRSMIEATAFFRRLCPERPFASITCNSWIFNNQLQDLRLSSHNLAAFQRELYLYPVSSSGRDGLWFIFFQDAFNSHQVPRETSLQRAVAEFLDRGHVWRGGGMFFLTDDFDRFGSQVYRRQAGTIANMAEL